MKRLFESDTERKNEERLAVVEKELNAFLTST